MKIHTSDRNKLGAFGILMIAFGFICGFASGGSSDSKPHQHPPHPPRGPAHHRPADPMPGMRWDRNFSGTTVIILQDGRPVGVQSESYQAVPAPPQPEIAQAPAPAEQQQEGTGAGVWLALLLLSGMAPLTWAALAWNRRRSARVESPFATQPFTEDFVPRRDD